MWYLGDLLGVVGGDVVAAEVRVQRDEHACVGSNYKYTGRHTCDTPVKSRKGGEQPGASAPHTHGEVDGEDELGEGPPKKYETRFIASTKRIRCNHK